jgi:hypothetical protein
MKGTMMTTTIQTYQDHRDGLVAVVRTNDSIVSVWRDGTATRTPIASDGEGNEEDITSMATKIEVII